MQQHEKLPLEARFQDMILSYGILLLKVCCMAIANLLIIGLIFFPTFRTFVVVLALTTAVCFISAESLTRLCLRRSLAYWTLSLFLLFVHLFVFSIFVDVFGLSISRLFKKKTREEGAAEETA